MSNAACYAVQCWAQYPEGSELYKLNYVNAWETQQLKNEIAWVREQNKEGRFTYTSIDRLTDKIAAATGLASGTFNGQLLGGSGGASTGPCNIDLCANRVSGLHSGAQSIPDGMYTMGLSGSAPLLGSIRLSVGASVDKGNWQYGVAIDTPILGVGWISCISINGVLTRVISQGLLRSTMDRWIKCSEVVGGFGVVEYRATKMV